MILSEICSIQSGGTPSRSKKEYWENGTIPWVKISDFNGKLLSETEENITALGLEGSSAKLFPKGTILYTIFATLGEVSILDIDATTNQAIAGITINDNSVDRDYLYYFLVSLKDRVNRIGRGVAQNNINLSILRSMEIPLPNRARQEQIARILTCVDKISLLQQQRLDLINQLVKARFVEMFGDPVYNPFGFPTAVLSEISDIVSGITKGRKTNSAELFEVPYMAVSNVKAGYIDWSTVKTIKATESEINQYRLQPFDVLMTEGGDPDKLGRGAMISNPPQNCIHQNHIFRVRVDSNVLLPLYLEEYLQHEKAKQYFLGCAKQTTGIASINMKQLRALPVLLPPMELQTQFAAFVQATDQTKSTIQASLDELETLKKSLMQEYFGRGENYELSS